MVNWRGGEELLAFGDTVSFPTLLIIKTDHILFYAIHRISNNRVEVKYFADVLNNSKHTQTYCAQMHAQIHSQTQFWNSWGQTNARTMELLLEKAIWKILLKPKCWTKTHILLLQTRIPWNPRILTYRAWNTPSCARRSILLNNTRSKPNQFNSNKFYSTRIITKNVKIFLSYTWSGLIY